MNTPSLSQVLLDAAKKHMRQSQAKPVVLPTGWVIRDGIQEGAQQAMSTGPTEDPLVIQLARERSITYDEARIIAKAMSTKRALDFTFAKTGLWHSDVRACSEVSYRIQVQTDGLFCATWHAPFEGGTLGEHKTLDEAKSACTAHAEANKPKPDRKGEAVRKIRERADRFLHRQKAGMENFHNDILLILQGLDA